MKKFDVAYFKYNKKGEETIKTESGITKRRLITLLEMPAVDIDVFNVEDAETGKNYLNSSEGQSILLDDLKHPGVNGIFEEGEL
jgi:hypothetical protein